MSKIGGQVRPEGIVGLLAIGLMVGVCAYLEWTCPWLYVVIATVFYLVSAVGFSLSRYAKGAWSANLAYLFLAAGLLIRAEGFWLNLAVFIVAASLGSAIPFIVHQEPRDENDVDKLDF